MCTVSIEVDDASLRRINPGLTNNESIRHWVQRYVNEFIGNLAASESQSAKRQGNDAVDMRRELNERIRRAEAGEESIFSNQEVLSKIKARYDL